MSSLEDPVGEVFEELAPETGLLRSLLTENPLLSPSEPEKKFISYFYTTNFHYLIHPLSTSKSNLIL